MKTQETANRQETASQTEPKSGLERSGNNERSGNKRAVSPQSPNLRPADTPRFRYRIRFGKVDLLRWISHRDLQSLWERVSRRVQLPLSMTEGFHPKPRMSFPSALSLGVESFDEVIEIELSESLPCDDLLARLQSDNQPGLPIHKVEQVPMSSGKAQLRAAAYYIAVPPDLTDAEVIGVRESISELLRRESVSIERKGKTVTAQVATQIPVLHFDQDASLTDFQDAKFPGNDLHRNQSNESGLLNCVELQTGAIIAQLVFGEGASLKIQDMLQLLGLESWPERGCKITRTSVFLKDETDITEHL